MALGDAPESAHIRLPANRQGRDFLLGDLHGMHEAFGQALKACGFDPQRDRVISVGDLIDRGPDSPACLRLLEEPWFHAVRGNHEQLMLDVLDGREDPALWTINGGDWSLAADLDGELAGPVAQARNLPHALTLERPDAAAIGVTHAEYPRSDWAEIEQAAQDEHDRQAMLWGRRVIKGGRRQDTANVALTVHGHTPIEAPLRLGTALFIDTGAVYGGSLTLLTVEQALGL
mgnify:CR=1 FL=1